MAESEESTLRLEPKSARADREIRLPAEYWLPPLGTVVVGRYRIEGLLGRGGMGVVALGSQIELDRPVAIKFLRAALAVNAHSLRRFAREARIVARMRSEHVVRVFDVGSELQVPFIVMELLHGHELSKEIERGPLTVQRAVEFALHACEALGEAHSLGIVHRDVKPSNLFVAEGFGGKETLKVLDFGVSKWLAPPVDLTTSSLSGDGAVGTPAFASPEQLARPEQIDCRTDVWSLGVVLYQALTGALPFEAATVPALYSRILNSDPAPFPTRHDVPAELVAVVERCLHRDPGARFASMLELGRALARFAPGRALASVESLATVASSERAAAAGARPEPTSLEPPPEFAGRNPEETDPTSSSRTRAKRAGASLLVAWLVLGGIALWWPRSAAVRRATAATNDTTTPAAAPRARANVRDEQPARVPVPSLLHPPATAAAVPTAPPAVLHAPRSDVRAREPHALGPTAKAKASLGASDDSAQASAAKPRLATAAPRADVRDASQAGTLAAPAPAESASRPPSDSEAAGHGIFFYRR